MAAEGADIGRLIAIAKILVDRPIDRKLKGNFSESRDFTFGRPTFIETMGL